MTTTKARACDGKQIHDKAGAQAHRMALIRNGAAANRVHAYHCPHCGHWHVGHWPRRRR